MKPEPVRLHRRRPRLDALLRRVQEVDDRAMRAVRTHRTPLLERVLPALSNAANHSLLWGTIAAGMLSTGNRRLRRAAQRGAMSVALASAVTNGILKPLLPRPRPTQPIERWFPFVRLPTSSSFPSGHSASAAAFATAVALESPAAAVPVSALAAGVAYSRVFTGVHHPSDVVVGAAVGVGTALLSTKVWARIDDTPAEAMPAPPTPRCDARTGNGLVVVANASAGRAAQQPALDLITEALPDATVVLVDDPDQIVPALEKAAANAETIGVLGGDGTVNTAAQVAVTHDIPLAVFPGGTLNHFARDLGVDTVQAAIDAVAFGSIVEIDTATIGGHLFLNTASFGTYSDFVRARERLENRIGKWPASAVALASVLRKAVPVEAIVDGQRRRVWMAFIGNGTYDPPGFVPATRADLSDGLLDVRLLDGTKRAARLWFLASMLTGQLERCPSYLRIVTDELRIDGLDGSVDLAADGEVFDGQASVGVCKQPRRLRVHAPAR